MARQMRRWFDRDTSSTSSFAVYLVPTNSAGSALRRTDLMRVWERRRQDTSNAGMLRGL